MWLCRLAGAACIVSFASDAAVQPSGKTPADLVDLLQAAGRYVDEYERSFSIVVSREHYVQRARTDGSIENRDLRSDVALVAVDEANWVLFRDVYEVDGRALRERTDRLAALFMKPTADLGLQAKRILEEGARYNVGPIVRTLNTPTQALDFIHPDNQRRSVFRLGDAKVIDGVETREVRFEETGKPRMIVTKDEAAASGRFWIQPETGTIVRTELRITSVGVSGLLTTNYARQPQLSLWVPTRMTESYDMPEPETRGRTTVLEGDATYTDFRKFSVNSRIIVR